MCYGRIIYGDISVFPFDGSGRVFKERNMERRTLGRTGLQVPVVGMGTWRTFDVRGEAAKRNARAIVDTALEADAHFFDSSPMYGAAEHVLGEALEGQRAKALVATKVWASTRSEGQSQ